MQHPDEGTIHGWLDHALADDDARRVEAHVAECAHCAAVVAEARGLIAAASRLLSSLDAADSRGTTHEQRMSAGRTAGEPRIGAEERGSIVLGSGIRAQGPGVVGGGEGGTRRAGRGVSWVPRSWATRVAALLTVAAAGAIAVSELPGPGGTKPLAGSSEATATVRRAPVPSSTPSSAPGAAVPKRAATHVAAARSSARTVAAAAARVSSPPSPPSATASSAAPPTMRRFRAPAPDAQDMMRAAVQSAAAMRRADVLSQQRRSIIRGRVVSTVGQPVAHASVALKGTRFGTMTKEDGSYALVVPATLAREKSAVVTVRLIGYQPASKAIALLVADSADHDFALAPSTLALNEVVVTGAGASADHAASASSVAAAPPPVRLHSDSVAPRRSAPALTLVSNSTRQDVHGRTVRRSIYEVRPGVQVTVDAMRATADEQGHDAPKPLGAQAERAAAPDTVAAPAAIAAGINSIQWTADGTRFTLSGPLPLAELRALKPLVH